MRQTETLKKHLIEVSPQELKRTSTHYGLLAY
jgi:hypothetical protein